MVQYLRNVLHWILLVLLILGIIAVVYFRWYEYLNYPLFKKYHSQLHSWANQHYFVSLLLYVLFYITVIILFIPASLPTIVGGFLFGPVSIIYSLFSATIGALILFFIVRTTVGSWIARRARGWVAAVEKSFRANAFNYLIFLRFLPIIPFWAVCIVAALLNVPRSIFLWSTILGVTPAIIIYTMLGSGLNAFFKTDQAPNLNIITSPEVLFPLLGLAVLALLPIIYRWLRGKKN